MSKVRRFVSRNPVTEQIAKEFDFISDKDLSSKIALSNQAFQQFKKTTFAEKAEKLRKLATILKDNHKTYAKVLTEEMGKPITQSEGEVLKSAGHCVYFADNMEEFLKPHIIDNSSASKIGYMYQPLGSLYLMTPFNFPFWLIFKAGIPMMAAGNTILSRTSDSTPQVGLLVEELFQKAGFNNGEFQNVFSHPSQLEQICASKHIAGISFTGSTFAGSQIAQVAAKHIKKSIMELGGSDPFIVLNDADLELATDLALSSRLLNCGQVCISAKRFIVDSKVHDEFLDKLIKKVEKFKIGDPLLAETQLGPMAREDLKQNIISQVQKGVKEGAQLLYQRKIAFDKGYYLGPQILSVQDQSNSLVQDEVFGPAFAIMKSKSEEESIQIANNTVFGLGSTIISKDTQRAEKVGHQLDTGAFFVNDLMRTDSRVPSGGVKQSGYGRECSPLGAREFTNVKSFWITQTK